MTFIILSNIFTEDNQGVKGLICRWLRFKMVGGLSSTSLVPVPEVFFGK